eukprot:comp15639_c0_seq1/m.24073 comp15639_c0_seq1/g.24073  ORF comp15639_c0_seq1/g.24073 comp15639_c0_seq1/m.24073 type:complete len:211 (-) comp15639_c0_seq1:54-686(-)
MLPGRLALVFVLCIASAAAFTAEIKDDVETLHDLDTQLAQLRAKKQQLETSIATNRETTERNQQALLGSLGDDSTGKLKGLVNEIAAARRRYIRNRELGKMDTTNAAAAKDKATAWDNLAAQLTAKIDEALKKPDQKDDLKLFTAALATAAKAQATFEVFVDENRRLGEDIRLELNRLDDVAAGLRASISSAHKKPAAKKDEAKKDEAKH